MPFTTITGIAAPIMRMNVDTDAIIPSREMKRVSKEGLAEGLFAGWRYLSPDNREANPVFILNIPPFNRASILIAGRNFGCGSSREHAVWALREWGIRAIIAPSFGSIFHANCIRNGLLPLSLDDTTVEFMAESVMADPACKPVTVDLRNNCVVLGDATWYFELPGKDRQMLLKGLDAIDVTLQDRTAIESFEAQDRTQRPWAYL